MTSKIIILSNGDIDDTAHLRTRLDTFSDATVIAADGGLRHALKLGLKVDFLIGDMDSVNVDYRFDTTDHVMSILEFPDAKDETDLELALTHAASMGANEIVILGALGGRLDMSLANVFLLTHPQLSDVKVELWVDDQTAWLIRPPGGNIPGAPGDTVSLIPLVNDAIEISTTNLAYPLKDASLKVGEVRGVSNLLADKNARVDLGEGTILVVHTPGRA